MKNWDELVNTTAQKEALLNELKGSLFEFLVASELARKGGFEKKFLDTLNPEILNTLQDYENWIRRHDQQLLFKLPVLSNKIASYIYELDGENLKNITMIGKKSSLLESQNWQEGDLLLNYQDGHSSPLSLKLCRKGSFVNTKSGGIKSFISKYFYQFESSSSGQISLSHFVNEAFETMARDIHLLADLEYRANWENWYEALLPDLPGKLEGEIRERVINFYHQVVSELFTILHDFYNQDSEKFVSCLFPLAGIGENYLNQIICFYKSNNQESYEYDGLYYQTYDSLKEHMQHLKFNHPKIGLASFEIELGPLRLQIRCKPMNKFTVPSLKVNCSIRFEGAM